MAFDVAGMNSLLDASDPRLRVFLVRHGQTDWNAEGRFLGRTDLSLNAAGHAQAATLDALRGRFDAVYSSPAARALETAAYLADAPVVVEGLAELDQGDLEGRFAADVIPEYPEFFAAWQERPDDVALPGGTETLADLVGRALKGLERIAREQPDRDVAVAAHQLVIATLCCVANGEPLANWRHHALGNCKAAVLIREGTTWRLETTG